MALQLALMRGALAGMWLRATCCSLLLRRQDSPHHHSPLFIPIQGAEARLVARGAVPSLLGKLRKATALSYRKSARLASPGAPEMLKRAPGDGAGQVITVFICVEWAEG